MLTSIQKYAVAAAFALAATPALAQEETDPPAEVTVSGTLATVTDYRFRGLSYSGGDGAVQASLNIEHINGLYAGVWTSNIEQDPADVFGDLEIDIYAGWTGEIASGLTADVGLTYYVYPSGSVGTANSFEPYASLETTLGPASAKVGVAYAWKQDALGGDDNLYLYTDFELGVPTTPITLSAHIGHTDGALSPNLLTLASTDGGWDYSLGATWTILPNLSAGVSYVGVDGNSIDGFSNDTIVGTLEFSF